MVKPDFDVENRDHVETLADVVSNGEFNYFIIDSQCIEQLQEVSHKGKKLKLAKTVHGYDAPTPSASEVSKSRKSGSSRVCNIHADLAYLGGRTSTTDVLLV